MLHCLIRPQLAARYIMAHPLFVANFPYINPLITALHLV